MAIREVMGSATGPALKCKSRLRVSLATIPFRGCWISDIYEANLGRSPPSDRGQ